MNARSTTQLLLTALVMGATALVTHPNSAAGNDGRATIVVPAPLTVTFGGNPYWETIPGTRVSWVREAERPSYDLFRYGSRYYIYNDNNWYRSDGPNRSFRVIDERYVPVAFGDVPNPHWRSYPQGWMNPKNPHYSGRHDNGNHGGKHRGKKNR